MMQEKNIPYIKFNLKLIYFNLPLPTTNYSLFCTKQKKRLRG